MQRITRRRRGSAAATAATAAAEEEEEEEGEGGEEVETGQLGSHPTSQRHYEPITVRPVNLLLMNAIVSARRRRPSPVPFIHARNFNESRPAAK